MTTADAAWLGHATGTTVNDIVVAAVAGAVGRHLRDHGDAVDEIHAMVPFNSTSGRLLVRAP